MNTERKPYCVNQIMKGEIIFERGSEAAYVGLVLKGRVRIQAEGVNLVIGSGHFLGLTDLQDGMYRVTYQAETDLAIYIFRAGELQATLQQIFKANKDYAALMVATLGKYIHALAGVYHTLEEQAERDYEFLQEQYRSYQVIGQELGITTDELPGIEELSPLMHWTALDEEKITYYDILSGLKQDVQKAYFGASETIAVYHIKDQINLLRDLLDQCEADAAYLQSLVGPMFRTDKNLYLSVLHMVATAKRIDADTKAGMEIFDKLIDEINRLEEVLYEQASINLQIDHNSMDNAYYSLICDGASQEETMDALTEEFALVEENFVSVEELDHSLEHILRYSELPIEQTQQFEADVRAFAALSDKMSTDDNARELRRNILKQYYPLYKAVYYKEYHSTEETPIEIDSGYYVAQVISKIDREATDKQKETIVEQRKSDRISELYTEWKDAAEITEDSDILAQITFDFSLTQETEASTEATTEAATEAGSESATEAATEAVSEATTEAGSEVTTEAATEAAETESESESETADKTESESETAAAK